MLRYLLPFPYPFHPILFFVGSAAFLCHQYSYWRQLLWRSISNNKLCILKEYFSSVVGPIKHAVLTYGPDGRSRGVATVEFKKSEDAAIAAQKYNGVEVDKRPMKVRENAQLLIKYILTNPQVELVVDPNAPASFADRVGYV